MTLSLIELSMTYQACISEAVRHSSLMIERWSLALANLLQVKATSTSIQSEKIQLRHAVVALKTQQQDLAKRFELELIRAIALDSKTPTAKKSTAKRSLSSISFDDLELMGDNQVQETLDSARLQQALSQTSEFELAGFGARMSTSQGYRKVEIDKNPLRPEVFAGALLKALRNSQIDAASQSCLLVHGALLMGKELQDLYKTLEGLLSRSGVAPAAYDVINDSSATNRKSFSPASNDKLNQPVNGVDKTGTATMHPKNAPSSAAQNAPSVTSDQLLTLDRLHRLMVGKYNDSFAPPLSAASADLDEATRNDFSHTVPAAMHMLDELKQQGLKLSQQKNNRAVPLPPVALIREHLKTEAKTLGQSVAIEVVGLMIGQLTNDYRLLPSVKQIIANAEPAFLRLAIMDPRFFSDKTHPARRLLDVITAKSLAYASEEAEGFAGFMHDLRPVAELLTEEHASDAQHFANLLKDFEQRQLHRTREADEAHARSIEVLRRAEERNILAGKIAAEVRIRPDFRAGNAAVTEFLMGPWSQVMAAEWLGKAAGGTNISDSPFSLALKGILRTFKSVDAPDALAQRQWLAHAVPSLLETLRAGLLTIDYPPESAKEFFECLDRIGRSSLTSLHSNEAEPIPAASDGPGATKIRNQALEKAFEAGDAADTYHWLAPSEASESGFMDFGAASASGSSLGFDTTQVEAPDAPVAGDQVNQPGPFGAGATASALQTIPLKVGDWVELMSDLNWLRAQLTFISPQNTLFMFTSEGGRSHSMTSRVLSHLLKLELVRIVNQHNVLDGALDSVAAKAIRNSVGSSFGR